MQSLYAAYGSNLHPARLGRRVPSATLVGTARLDGWRLRFNKAGRDGSGKCNIVEADESIHVAVFEMRASERPVLNRIEGLNLGYGAVELEVPGFGRCFSYRAEASHVDEMLAPYSWYKELVLIGCERHGFPGSYVAAIREVADMRDPDMSRHVEHMQIVSAARQSGSAPRPLSCGRQRC